MLDADQIYRNIIDFGNDWADKKAAYQLLDDMTSTIKADLTTDTMKGYKCSKSEAEIRALSHPLYKEHLAALATARRVWLQAEVKYKGANLLAELRRSEESTRRQEMKL